VGVNYASPNFRKMRHTVLNISREASRFCHFYKGDQSLPVLLSRCILYPSLWFVYQLLVCPNFSVPLCELSHALPTPGLKNIPHLMAVSVSVLGGTYFPVQKQTGGDVFGDKICFDNVRETHTAMMSFHSYRHWDKLSWCLVQTTNVKPDIFSCCVQMFKVR